MLTRMYEKRYMSKQAVASIYGLDVLLVEHNKARAAQAEIRYELINHYLIAMEKISECKLVLSPLSTSYIG